MSENTIFVSVYVDDLIIVETAQIVEWIIHYLQGKFMVTGLGPVRYLSYMEISYAPEKFIWLPTEWLYRQVLKRFSMYMCHSVSAPQAQDDLT